MAYDIGTARGVIELTYNGRGADDAKKSLDDINKKGMSSQEAMTKVGNTAGIAGAAIAAGLGAGIVAAANFEQRMSAIGAVSGASGKQMDALRSKALQLGKDTQYSASESAQAIEELIKAGLSVSDVLNGAADATVNLAAAGEVSMPEAAQIASNAMNQFGLSAKDMVGVVDQIAGASNASAIDVSDFGQSLSQVGAVAHLAGVNFKDTATAIAIMGNAGIKGSDAGTSLKTMFQRLQPVTKKQKDMMKELGLITEDGANKFYTAAGKTKSLAQVSQVLKNSLKGMTQQQKQATLQTLFGSDAIRGAAILADAGAKGFDKMSKAMGKVSAADVAAKRMDNFKGSIEQMKGSLETAGIAIGTILIPPLRTLVDALTSALNWFLNLSDGQQKAITVFAAVVAAILLIIAAVFKIIVAVAKFQEAMVALRGTMIATWAATLGPIALVIAAIALVVAAIIILWKHSETFRSIVTGAWNAVKAAASSVADWFTGTLVPALQGAWDAIVGGVQAIGNFFKSLWNGIVNIVKGALGLIVTAITMYIGMWSKVIQTGLAVIGAVWSGFWNSSFGGLVKAVFNLIVAIIQYGMAVTAALFRAGFGAIRAITSTTWNAIVGVIRKVWGVVSGVVKAGVNRALGFLRAGWNAVRSVTSSVWNRVAAVVRSVVNKIVGFVRPGVNRAKAVVQAAWNAVRGVTSSVWNKVVSIIKSAVGRAVAAARGIKDRIVGFFRGAGTWLFSAGKAIIGGLINGIDSMIRSVTSKLNSLTAKIKAAKGPPEKDKVLLEPAGEQIMQSLINGFDNLTPNVIGAMTDLTRMLGTPLATSDVRPRATASTSSAQPTGLRLVSGRLSFDKSGRAFISGVAQEVVNNNKHRDNVGVRRGAGR